jgi:hypothetical protein
LHIAEDVVSGFVLFLANFCADFDEEGVFLEPCKQVIENEGDRDTSSPSVDHFSKTFPISSYFMPICLFIISHASLIQLIMPLLHSVPLSPS